VLFLCAVVKDHETVTRRNAVSATERVQSNGAERQQNIAGDATADACVGSPSDSGTSSTDNPQSVSVARRIQKYYAEWIDQGRHTESRPEET